MEYERKLVLNDGTVFEDGECGYAEHTLWCYVKNCTMAEAFAVFSDPNKTQEIKFIYGTKEVTYVGFTEMNLIKVSEFTIDIRLVGENTSIITEEGA